MNTSDIAGAVGQIVTAYWPEFLTGLAVSMGFTLLAFVPRLVRRAIGGRLL